MTLAAGRLEPFIPRLIPRGTNLCGTGRRFFLRVEQADADEARQVLKEAEDEDSDPRCMRCGSRVSFETSGSGSMCSTWSSFP